MYNNKIRIISDSHFNHQSIIDDFEFRPKNFASQICRKVRNNVRKDDVLIHLWDVIFYKHAQLEDYLNSMWECKKILVKWNHDKKSNSFYMSKWFDFVVDSMEIGSILFTHIPISNLKEWQVNVHWHCHHSNRKNYDYNSLSDKWKYSLYSPIEENFMPVLLDKLVAMAKYKSDL